MLLARRRVLKEFRIGPWELCLSRIYFRVLAVLLVSCSGPAWSQSAGFESGPADRNYSSSSVAALVSPDDASTSTRPAAEVVRPSNKPFSAFAIALKVGTGGIGPEIATPLNSFMNLRGSFQIFDSKLNFKTSGIHSMADLTIQNAQASVDIFPFHGRFHISPGVTVYGDNHLTSNLSVPGGTSFLLGPDGYTSDPNDPVTGLGRIKFGNPVAPRLTIGWGNMLPRNGGHFSIPFEIGFQYISAPTLEIDLNGSVCDPNNSCGPVGQGTEPQDLQTEINQLETDLRPLRFYPIIAIGFSYKFGH